MARYIDADALIDFLDVGHLRHPSDLCFSEVDVANLLLHAPALSPDEVRGVGEWEEIEVMPKAYDICGVETWASKMQCCNCGFTTFAIGGHFSQYNYCPSCGARMKGADA